MKFAQPTSKPSAGKISLTPLIDVVFILLLFFMLTSTFADRRSMELATPALTASPEIADKAVTLTLTTSGLEFEGAPLSVDDIDGVLHARLASGDPVTLLVGVGVNLETSIGIMDALKDSGARSIALRNAGAAP